MKKTWALSSLLLISATVAPAQTKKGSSDVKKTTTPAVRQSIERGRMIYNKYCLTCHQADGGGVPNMNPPLIKTTYVNGDKNRLITIVIRGLDEEIEINGDTYSNPMPAHNFLKDQEIADVLTFIRNNFGNKASPVTGAEVKKNRK